MKKDSYSRNRKELQRIRDLCGKNCQGKRYLYGGGIPFFDGWRIVNIQWHVIDWEEGDREHSHEKHKIAGLGATWKVKK